MLAKRIIPCLDVDRGRVVKGINFVGLRDAGDPVEIARRYNEQGADELTFLDITASSDERDLILHVVEEVAAQVFIPLTVGGGVRKVEDVRRLLNAGADKVSINTAAVHSPDLVRDASSIVGNQCIVVAIDAKRNGLGWEVYTHVGRRRQSRAPGAGRARGKGGRGACGEHLPFWRVHRWRSQAASQGAGHRGAHVSNWLDDVPWNGDGLIAAVAQDADSGRVLTVAWMNREALAQTAATREAVYWSRSRSRLWRKGEQSSHVQKVRELRLDCDADAVLLQVEQVGGIACHTGRESCFFRKLENGRWVTVDPVLKDPSLIYKK